MNLIGSTLGTVAVSERAANRRPVRTSRKLTGAVRRLAAAGLRLVQASRELAEVHESLELSPETAARAIELVELAAWRWQAIADHLRHATTEVAALQLAVLAGLESGALVPERPGDDRPRIVLTPRPFAIRAFLLRRQPRVIDRIASILRRRRRIPRPTPLRVPRRSVLGRAPPLSSVCPL